MPQPLTIFLTAVVTLAVTVISGVVLDFIRNARPTVSYSIKDAIPIDLGDHKRVGAYMVSLVNTSRRVVKDLVCHIEAGEAKLRNGGVEASQGFEMDIQESDTCLAISIPYLKKNERFEITVIAEGVYIPKTPAVAVRSPNDITVVTGDRVSPSLPLRFAFAGLVAACVGILASLLAQQRLSPMSQRDVLTFAASVTGLPKLAEAYATSTGDLSYYSQGDLAYALAAATSDRSEIEKYRRLLAVTLEENEEIWTTSRANLYYSMGKIDLLQGNKDKAAQDFREALRLDKSLTVKKSRLDEPAVRNFLASNAID
jgi:tetratricopeptide (TPR) repeat protein